MCKHIQAGNHAWHDNFMEKVPAHQPAPEHLWHTICQRSAPLSPSSSLCLQRCSSQNKPGSLRGFKHSQAWLTWRCCCEQLCWWIRAWWPLQSFKFLGASPHWALIKAAETWVGFPKTQITAEPGGAVGKPRQEHISDSHCFPQDCFFLAVLEPSVQDRWAQSWFCSPVTPKELPGGTAWEKLSLQGVRMWKRLSWKS